MKLRTSAAKLISSLKIIETPAKPAEETVVCPTFLTTPFCLLFVIKFACFWWEFQDKIVIVQFHLNRHILKASRIVK